MWSASPLARTRDRVALLCAAERGGVPAEVILLFRDELLPCAGEARAHHAQAACQLLFC